jgi:hypothetical protein
MTIHETNTVVSTEACGHLEILRRTHNSVFIKLRLDVKHSTLNRYFAFVVS